MQTINIRNLPSLHRQKIIIITIVSFFFGYNNLFAQYNYRNKESKPYYFGISLGFHNSKYQIIKNENFLTEAPSNNLYNIQSISGPGVNVHIINNFKIGKFIDIRALPGFAFTTRNFVQTDGVGNNATLETTKVQPVYFEMPVQFRAKSMPYKDFRAYVLGGIKYSYDIQNKSRGTKNTVEVNISPNDFLVEFGLGMQFFFKYFILSPEVKFSQGLNNSLNSNYLNGKAEFPRYIERIRSQAFTFTLHFEG